MEKKYKLKIPVYTTEVVTHDNEVVPLSCEEMVSNIEMFLKEFTPICVNNKNKTKRTVISQIIPKREMIGNTPSLLLQVSAFDTNMYDGFFVGGEDQVIEIQKSSKLGSDTNFFLLYPIIQGFVHDNYKAYFLLLVYEDPTKDSDEICKLARCIARKVLQTPVRNIKLPMVIDELKQYASIPSLQIKYYTASDVDDGLAMKYSCYVQKTTIKKSKEDVLKDVPSEIIEEIIDDDDAKEQYSTRDITISVGKKEYRIKAEVLEKIDGLDKMQRTAETVFNAFTEVSQTELDERIHEEEFMMYNFTQILMNYLACEGES